MQLVCQIAEIPADPGTLQVSCGDSSFILAHWRGQLYAYLNKCPHLGWPLNLEPGRFLDIDNRFLQCSNHMALFEVDSGRCVSGPCPGACLTAIRIEQREDGVYLDLPQD